MKFASHHDDLCAVGFVNIGRFAESHGYSSVGLDKSTRALRNSTAMKSKNPIVPVKVFLVALLVALSVARFVGTADA